MPSPPSSSSAMRVPMGVIEIDVETSISNYLKNMALYEDPTSTSTSTSNSALSPHFENGKYSATLQLTVFDERDNIVFTRNSDEIDILDDLVVGGRFVVKFALGYWSFQVDMILSTPAGYLPYIGTQCEALRNKPSFEFETTLFNESDYEEEAIIAYDFSRSNLCFNTLILDCTFNPSSIQIGLSSLLGLLNQQSHLIEGEDNKISFTENLLLLHQFVDTTVKGNNAGLLRLFKKYEEQYDKSKNLKAVINENLSCLSMIQLHKAVKIAMDILTPIIRGFNRSPNLNYDIIHHQFDKFCQYIVSNRHLSSGDNEIIFDNDQIDSLSLRKIIIFVSITGLWFSQHAYTSYFQCHALRMTSEEYCDLRDKFQSIDTGLNGYISGHSLLMLFQDIGLDSYSLEDCEIIQNMIDRDGINCIDFIEFLQWWASDSIMFDE